MSEEILINVTPVETRVALVENGMLQEVYVERTSNAGIVGNIYKGRVVRVLPGMEAAFLILAWSAPPSSMRPMWRSWGARRPVKRPEPCRISARFFARASPSSCR